MAITLIKLIKSYKAIYFINKKSWSFEKNGQLFLNTGKCCFLNKIHGI